MTVSRRSFLRKVAGTAAACFAGGATLAGRTLAQAGNGSKGKRPNILVILADDYGYEALGANGGAFCGSADPKALYRTALTGKAGKITSETPYRTPVLDKLAAEGVRFEHGYAQPLCTPTRVQLMTGMYNVRNYVRFGLLDPKATTFAHLLKKAGYATCVVGKWQLGGGFEGPGHFGFDEYCLWQLTRRPGRYPNPGLEINGKEVDTSGGKYGPAMVSDYACDFLRRHKDKPFCLYYPMMLTHCPFTPTPDSDDWDPNATGEPSYKGVAKYFPDMVKYMDKAVGKLLATLDEIGQRDNTLVIFMGDNGTDRPVVTKMPDGRIIAGTKGRTNDGGTHVPLIASAPGGARGKVSHDLVDTSDILPTVCECAGVKVPASLAVDGRSFLPQLRGEKGTPRQWTYCWYSRQGVTEAAKVYARNQRYKLYSDRKMYDIPADPLETSPLAADSLSIEARKVRKMLQGVLDKYANARPAKLNQKPKPKKAKKR